MFKRLNVVVILALLLGNVIAQAQEVLPIGKDNILVFIEPFEDHGPDHGQAWLQQGLPGFLKSQVSGQQKIHVYTIADFSSSLVDRPHKYQDLIWKSVFRRDVDSAYETYLVLGSYSYLDGQITIRMDLLSLRNTQVVAHFEKSLPYTKLLSWKNALGEWLLSQMKLGDATAKETMQPLPNFDDGITPVPGVSLRQQLTSLFDTKQKQEEIDLQRKYEQQSRMKLGTQLESLWKDIAYEPYLANIHDIHTLRLQSEPDSVAISFKVSYQVNPRILDEIEHFSKTRAGLVEKTESFDGHAFMDLGYIDAEFTKAVAGGDWRVVPVITMGAKTYPQRRVFYHSFPRPISSPGTNFRNRGEFKQLLMAIPGVNALRIFVQESQQVYDYEIVVGYDEIKDLDKIQVTFVPEQDLSKRL